MKRDEKFKAIIERIKAEGHDFEPMHISAMVITGYLTSLSEKKIIESGYLTTPIGKMIVAICEEFDWQPSDEELVDFINGMIDMNERPAFLYLLKRYRDDRQGLIQEFEQFSTNNGNSAETS